MFRISRLAILAFSFFFFQAGLLEAYVRCLEVRSSVEDRSERVKNSIQNSASDDEMSHCEDWSAHPIIAAPHSFKKDPRTDPVQIIKSQPVIVVAADHTNWSGWSVRLFVAVLSQFLYPSIAIYQAKGVYRI